MNEGNFIIKALKDDPNILTKNKIYEFVDGCTIFDNGLKSSCYKDFNDLLKRNFGWVNTIQQLVVAQTNKIYEPKNENKYSQLYFSPVSYIRLDGVNEEYFIKTLKENKPIIFTSEQRQFTYDKIPQVIQWLQNVYDYATELKNKVEYVDFNTAKEYMRNGGKAKYSDDKEEYTYYIKGENIYCEEDGESCAFSLKAIESTKWILL
jgi:hypothetical protein